MKRFIRSSQKHDAFLQGILSILLICARISGTIVWSTLLPEQISVLSVNNILDN